MGKKSQRAKSAIGVIASPFVWLAKRTWLTVLAMVLVVAVFEAMKESRPDLVTNERVLLSSVISMGLTALLVSLANAAQDGVKFMGMTSGLQAATAMNLAVLVSRLSLGVGIAAYLHAIDVSTGMGSVVNRGKRLIE